MVINNRPQVRYPRQGPSCMLVLVVIFFVIAGVTLIVNADEVREAIIPTATPEPTRNAVDLAARADRLRRDGQIIEAISLYQAAVTQDGTNVRFYPPLIELLVLLERGEEAVTLIRQANELAPGDEQVLLAMAAAYLAYGSRLQETGFRTEAMQNYDLADRAARDTIAVNSNIAAAYAYRAQALLYQNINNLFEAQEMINKAVELDEDDRIVLRGRATLLEYQGQYEAAVRIYEQLMRGANSDLERARLSLSIAYNNFALRNTPGAINYFNDALAYDPNNADAYDGLAYMYFLIGEYPRAQSNAEKAIELDPEMVRAKARLGASLFRQNNYERSTGAIFYLEQAVAKYGSPDITTAIYFNMLGLSYVYTDNKCDQARPLFEQVQAAIPDEPNSLYGLELCRDIEIRQ